MAPPDVPAPPPDLARFAQVVAHELRNPLSAVKIALQTLERHADLAEKDGLRLAIALREVGTIDQVLSQILEWARPGELKVAEIALDELVDDAVALARPALDEKRLRLVREGELESLLVRADRPRLARAIGELVRNAAQASPDEAPVVLRVEKTADGAAITVVDRGEGFADGDLARAFEPFFSRRAKGIGLGLCRARDIARRHGGEVTLEAGPDGARATLRLPG